MHDYIRVQNDNTPRQAQWKLIIWEKKETFTIKSRQRLRTYTQQVQNHSNVFFKHARENENTDKVMATLVKTPLVLTLCSTKKRFGQRLAVLPNTDFTCLSEQQKTFSIIFIFSGLFYLMMISLGCGFKCLHEGLAATLKIQNPSVAV